LLFFFIIIITHNQILQATTFAGPWSAAVSIHTPGSSPRWPGVGLTWEDPYIWQDERGRWHLLVLARLFSSYLSFSNICFVIISEVVRRLVIMVEFVTLLFGVVG
jgi:hypothetical protein